MPLSGKRTFEKRAFLVESFNRILISPDLLRQWRIPISTGHHRVRGKAGSSPLRGSKALWSQRDSRPGGLCRCHERSAAHRRPGRCSRSHVLPRIGIYSGIGRIIDPEAWEHGSPLHARRLSGIRVGSAEAHDKSLPLGHRGAGRTRPGTQARLG